MLPDNLLDALRWISGTYIRPRAVLVTDAAVTLFRGRRGTMRSISGMLEMDLGALVA